MLPIFLSCFCILQHLLSIFYIESCDNLNVWKSEKEIVEEYPLTDNEYYFYLLGRKDAYFDLNYFEYPD